MVPDYGTRRESVHVFDKDSIAAVNAALAAQRPLLVRGEPGTGKSQLARAAAAALGRAFLSFTVDARSEARDLKFTVDTVARLAEAQVQGTLSHAEGLDIREELAEKRFTTPGPLWWAFNWDLAAKHSKAGDPEPWKPKGWKEADGVVVLIDEIDKADPAVPNGLLEALGEARFEAPGGIEVRSGGVEPLVVITTNEERALPDAFLRRCLVLQLAWPEGEEAFTAALRLRGEAHFEALGDGILDKAAAMVWKDRREILRQGLCPPGGAEYLDLLRVLATRWPEDPKRQEAALDEIGKFALRKHPRSSLW
jgi:MoxR-like ATPase